MSISFATTTQLAGVFRPRPSVQRRIQPVCRRATSEPGDISLHEWSAERLGFTQVGVVLGAHGVRGDVRVRSVGDFGSDRLTGDTTSRYLLRPGRKYPRPVAVSRGRRAPQSGIWLARFASVDSREAAMTLRGSRVFVRDDELPPLGTGEYSAALLVGCRVHLEGVPIGVVRTVHFAADTCGKKIAALTSDTLEIALIPAEEMEDLHAELNRTKPSDMVELSERKCVLLPFVEQIIPVVDIDGGFIEINPPEGLLDIAIVNRQKKPKPPRGLLMAAGATSTEQ